MKIAELIKPEIRDLKPGESWKFKIETSGRLNRKAVLSKVAKNGLLKLLTVTTRRTDPTPEILKAFQEYFNAREPKYTFRNPLGGEDWEVIRNA